MSDIADKVDNPEPKPVTVPPKKKTKMQMFLNFLAMGGFLVIILVGVILAVVISVWINSCQAAH
jgi:hypothetical protein